MNRAIDSRKAMKMMVQMLCGGIVGAGAVFAFLLLSKGVADFDDPSRLAAAAVGIVFLLIGTGVGIGATMPRIGAKYLNVQDAEELVEERKPIGTGAITCGITGIMILALSLAPGGDAGGAFSREATLAVVAIALAGLVVISFTSKRGMDEFNRQMGIEAAATAMHVSVVLLFLWAALAHLGYVGWVTPLGLVAFLSWTQLATIFWVVGKRGMLMPR